MKLRLKCVSSYFYRSAFYFGITIAIIVSTVVVGYQSSCAADAPTPNPSSGGGLLLILWLVCYLRRKRSIGGWLLYFFIALWFGFLVSFALSAPAFKGLLFPDPSTTWRLYLSYLMNFIGMTILIAMIVNSIILASPNWRAWKYALLMRRLLLMECIVSAASVPVDVGIDTFATVLDLWTVVTSLIWYTYFRRSIRVDRVFRTNTWNVVQEPVKKSDESYSISPTAALKSEEENMSEAPTPVPKTRYRLFHTVHRILPESVLVLGATLILVRLLFPPQFVLIEGIRRPYSPGEFLYPVADYQVALMQCLAIGVFAGVIFYILRKKSQER
jgi:hypothetical protein